MLANSDVATPMSGHTHRTELRGGSSTLLHADPIPAIVCLYMSLDIRVTVAYEKTWWTRERRSQGSALGRKRNGFRVAGRYPAVARNGAQIRRSRIDSDRDAQHGGARPQARIQDVAGSQGARAGAVEARHAGRIRRSGAFAARARGGVGGGASLDRAAQPRRRRVRPLPASDPAAAAGEDEGEISLSGPARREIRGLRADRARRRQRSRPHEDSRRPPGRSLRHQRLQALHLAREGRRFSAARRLNRSGEGLARRALGLHRRYGFDGALDRPREPCT